MAARKRSSKPKPTRFVPRTPLDKLTLYAHRAYSKPVRISYNPFVIRGKHLPVAVEVRGLGYVRGSTIDEACNELIRQAQLAADALGGK